MKGKLIAKISAITLGVAMAIGVGVSAGHSALVGARAVSEETFDCSAQGWANQSVHESFSGANFAVTIDKGTNSNTPKYYNNGTNLRIYGGGTITFSSTNSGLNLASISFASSAGNALSANVGTWSSPNWSGDSESVVFSVNGTSGNFRFVSVTVGFVSTGGGSTASVKSVTITHSGEMTNKIYENTDTKWDLTGLELGADVTMDDGSDFDGTVSYTYSPASPKEMGVTSLGNLTIKAVAGGVTSSNYITITGIIVTAAKGSTVDNPYTVAEARAAIDAGTGVTGVYATGIVSAIPTAYSEQYKNITFNIVDNSGDSTFLQAYRCKGDEAANVEVGDTVVVTGNLKKYNSTYEFDANCVLVSLVKPVVDTKYTITFDSDGGTDPEAKEVGEGLTFVFPSAGTKTGYILKGWSSDNGVTIYGEGTTSAGVEADATYVAIWTTKGAEADPYTVAEARAAIDDEKALGLRGAYVAGIVSEIPTAYDDGYKNVTFNIVDNSGDSDFLQAFRCKGDEAANVKVGDTVVVTGNLKKYNSTYEFDANCVLVSRSGAADPQMTGIEVTTQPTKKEYNVGESFDPTGMVVKVNYDNDTSVEITDYTYTPSGALALTDTKVIISYGEFNAEVAIKVTEAPIPPQPETKTFVKTTEITDGQYLIVYEEGNVAFNSSLETLDAASNFVEVEINEGEIELSDAYAVTIDATSGSILAANGKYIGRNSDTNGMDVSSSALEHALSIDSDGNAVILSSGGAYFRYNATSGQDRFRYFKSATYTAQKAVQLYKVDDGTNVKLESIEITNEPDKTVYFEGETFDPTGMEVTAHYSDSTSAVVTDYTWAPSGALEVGNDEVVISYKGQTIGQPIEVKADAISSIAIGGEMTKTEYKETDTTWDASGLTVSATYESGREGIDVTSDAEFSFNPESPAAMGKTTSGELVVTATVGEKQATKNVAVVVTENVVADDFGLNGTRRFISHTRDEVTYFLKDNGTGSAPSAITDPSEATLFTFELADEDNTFVLKASEDTWLYSTATNNGVRVGTNAANTWKVQTGTSGKDGSFELIHVGTGRFMTLYNAQDFRAYQTADASNRLENTDLPAMDKEFFANEFMNLYTGSCDATGEENKITMWENANNLYGLLSDSDKETLKTYEADEKGDTLAKALARYEYIVSKYGPDVFADFLERGITKSAGSNNHITSGTSTLNNNTVIMAIAITTLISVSVLGVTFVIVKRRKEQ